VRGFIKDLPSVAAKSAGNLVGVLRSAATAFFSVLTVVILTIYLLLDFPRIEDGALRLVARSRREQARRIIDVIFARISGYLLGQLSVSVIAGVAAMIALAAIGLPYWLPLAIWVGFAAVIPMVGATIGAIPAVIVAFFASPVKGLITVAYFFAYQQTENSFIHPRVMRQAVDISPPAVILSALIGASLLGFVGALLAIPLAASLKALTQELWLPRQELK
jgi:predicted PurR-regulated permease PerM